MENYFFEWGKFKEEYDLPELPQMILDDNFFIDLEKEQIYFSKQLSYALFHKNRKANMMLSKLNTLFSESSYVIYQEDIKRLCQDKQFKSISRLDFMIEGNQVPGLFIMLKAPGRPYIVGMVYLCFDMMSDFKEHMDSLVQKLQDMQDINQLILEGSTDYIYQLDVQHNVCTFSPKAMEVIDIDAPTFPNAMDKLLSIIVPEDRSIFLESFVPFFTGQSEYHHSEYRVYTKEGDIMWISCNGKGKHDAQGRPLVIAGSLMDITDKKRAEESINKLINYDNLTGLKNRYCFEQELTEYMKKENAKGSVICIDICNFKMFNETFGHKYGDKILQAFTDILKTYVSDNRGIYRLEGDEFVIHMEETSEEKIRTQLIPLQMAVNTARLLDGHNIYIDIAIGIAIYPEHGDTPEALFGNVDTMMSDLTRDSKSSVMLFMNDKDSKFTKRYQLKHEIRKDIENEFEHFRVVFQPIVKVEPNGKYWTSTEALLRYYNPEMPGITLKELIDTLEYTDLIIPVGRWVLEQAVRECSRWREQGCEISVHVNFSAQQISDAGILSYIGEILEKYDLEPENLIIELTETSLVNNFDTAVILCKELIRMGVRIALDDFGTGYSSFNYLRNLPINQIKVDRVYVQNLINDNYNQIIISCLNDLSRNMGVELCVEGVETKETLDILTNMGISLIQGFYFERPMENEIIRKEIINHAKMRADRIE